MKVLRGLLLLLVVFTLVVWAKEGEDLQKRFAKAYKQYGILENTGGEGTTNLEQEEVLTSYFVLKTRFEDDKLIKELSEEHQLSLIRKIKSVDDGSVNYIMRGRQFGQERSLLNQAELKSFVKRHANTVLDFYQDKKYRFSKR